MSTQQVELVGDRRCQATLLAAADQLDHLDRAAAGSSRVVAASGGAKAPRRTGALAMSVRAMPEGAMGAAGATVRYAPYVHWGTRYMRARPFLTDATRQTQPVWESLYAADADRALGTVRGA